MFECIKALKKQNPLEPALPPLKGLKCIKGGKGLFIPPLQVERKSQA